MFFNATQNSCLFLLTEDTTYKPVQKGLTTAILFDYLRFAHHVTTKQSTRHYNVIRCQTFQRLDLLNHFLIKRLDLIFLWTDSGGNTVRLLL